MKDEIMNTIAKKTPLLLTSGLLFISATGLAAVNLDRTRLVYNAADKSTAITLTNESKTLPYLAQSWVEDDKGKKADEMLIALPPLQRIEAGDKSQVRIVKGVKAESLPTDRESLFYFNTREVPPKSEKKNVMQVAIQSRIKLFYRPQSIQRSSHVNPEQKITLQTVGNQLTITNPTPYYFTALAVKDSQGNKIKEVDGEMVAPHSDRNISVAGLRLRQRISISYINDFGGVISMLYRCENNICKFEKSNEG